MNPMLSAVDPAFRRQAAEDLRTLAWLHAAERSTSIWLSLGASGFPEGMVLQAPAPAGAGTLVQALRDLEATVRALHASADVQRFDDRLAADYAGIYLTHALRASPYESVWRDDDGLMMQAATFAVRRAYAEHGMVAPDWRTMPDDHLALELSFVAHLLDTGALEAAARFLDRHLLVWLPDFAARVAQRADTLVYAGLALCTHDAVQALREAIDVPRLAPEPLGSMVPAVGPTTCGSLS